MARPLAFDASFKIFSTCDPFFSLSEIHHIKLFLQLASELKGTELHCPVNSSSKMLIEVDRAHLMEFFKDYTML